MHRIKKKTLATIGVVVAIFGVIIALAFSNAFSEYIGVPFANHFFSDGYSLGKVTSVHIHTLSQYGTTFPVQDLGVELLNGSSAGQNVAINDTGLATTSYNQPLRPGTIIVVVESTDTQGDVQYNLADRFRLPAMLLILIAFITAIIVVARWRGFTSLLGLGVSVLVIVGFIIPQILRGGNPLWVVLSGTLTIAIASLYLAHGFNKRTSIAVLGAVTTILCSLLLALLLVYMTNITGIGSEESFFLSLDVANLNFTAFFLGAVLIGALGVLADVAIGQSSTVEELHRADPEFNQHELYRRGMSVGREHIASLVNTLVLAYAGTSFSLLFLFFVNPNHLPLWSIVNSEQIADVFIQTVVGSLALVLAVPITTVFASYLFGKANVRKS